jgi:hypothetical protein
MQKCLYLSEKNGALGDGTRRADTGVSERRARARRERLIGREVSCANHSQWYHDLYLCVNL